MSYFSAWKFLEKYIGQNIDRIFMALEIGMGFFLRGRMPYVLLGGLRRDVAPKGLIRIMV
jgi:hypothetical protein